MEPTSMPIPYPEVMENDGVLELRHVGATYPSKQTAQVRLFAHNVQNAPTHRVQLSAPRPAGDQVPGAHLKQDVAAVRLDHVPSGQFKHEVTMADPLVVE